MRNAESTDGNGQSMPLEQVFDRVDLLPGILSS
jgi:hypothetical protein